MGQAVAVRSDFTSSAVRRLAQWAKNAAQARRLLAIAAVLDGASRAETAKAGGMDRQTLRDWVIRFNEEGPDGLINKPSPGAPSKLSDEHKAFLSRIVDQGPIPAVHGVVRWRACDLIMRLHEKFGLSVSDDTVYRALKELGFSHVSARPRAYKQSTDQLRRSKKLCCPRGRNPQHARPGYTDKSVVPGRDASRPKEQADLSLGQNRLETARHPRPTHAINLSVRSGLPRTRHRCRLDSADLQQRGDATAPRPDRH
jgi:putative transposase